VEYLVTMTTHVPEGTSEADVEDVRAREQARSSELAAQGHLLRLWRPPLQPGEWRSLGLFAAEDADRLEEVLASMPLRVWRTDEVIPLSPHPNDPVHPRPRAGAAEFLVRLTITVPEGTPAATVEQLKQREAVRVRELAERGNVVRLWRPPAGPGEWRALGVWRADDAADMHAVLESLPLYDWFTVDTTPLARHPNDPGISRADWTAVRNITPYE
jgi:muconolactone delta-isomerase